MRRANRFNQRRVNDPNSFLNLRQRNRRNLIINRANNANNQRRVISYRRRNNRRNRGRNLPRFRYNFRNPSNNNNQFTSLNNKINNLISDFNKMTLKNNPVSNRFKTSKEMRRDRLISAMNMVKYSNKLGWFKTNLRVIKLDHYMQYNFSPNTDCYFFWSPYTYPLAPGIQLQDSQGQTGNADRISGLLYLTPNSMNCLPMDQVKLDGTCRLVSATMKIMNITAATDRAGTYTVYQTTNNFITPYIYCNALGSVPPNTYKQWYDDLIDTGSLNTLSTKMVYSANDVGYIEEFNTHEGTNIFNSCKEYLGLQYLPIAQKCIGLPAPITEGKYPNPIGPNISYIIKIPKPPETQQYIIETWCIWEVAPSPESGMSNLAAVHNDIFDKEVFDQASNYFPFHK